EGAAQTEPGGGRKRAWWVPAGSGSRCGAVGTSLGGRRSPAAPCRGREGGLSPRVRRPTASARAPAPLCAWHVTRGRSCRRAGERRPAPWAPFQAQQRPRGGPALTHFLSRLLSPRPRILRPPPSRCEPSGGARGRRRGPAHERPARPASASHSELGFRGGGREKEEEEEEEEGAAGNWRERTREDRGGGEGEQRDEGERKEG
ncbi:hypothetical protein P7K49_012828, partial [Saguinus oedipus]